MMAQSHAKIATVAMEHVKGRGIYLDREAFILGNIIPDFSIYHKFIRHYPTDSTKYLTRMYEEVGKGIPRNSKRNTSFKLGIICHYLTDYCCYPHFNEQRCTNKAVVEHLEYEIALNSAMDSVLSKHLRAKEVAFEGMGELLEFQKATYKNNKVYSEDVGTAINVVVNAINSIQNC